MSHRRFLELSVIGLFALSCCVASGCSQAGRPPVRVALRGVVRLGDATKKRWIPVALVNTSRCEITVAMYPHREFCTEGYLFQRGEGVQTGKFTTNKSPFSHKDAHPVAPGNGIAGVTIPASRWSDIPRGLYELRVTYTGFKIPFDKWSPDITPIACQQNIMIDHRPE